MIIKKRDFTFLFIKNLINGDIFIYSHINHEICHIKYNCMCRVARLCVYKCRKDEIFIKINLITKSFKVTFSIVILNYVTKNYFTHAWKQLLTKNIPLKCFVISSINELIPLKLLFWIQEIRHSNYDLIYLFLPV